MKKLGGFVKKVRSVGIAGAAGSALAAILLALTLTGIGVWNGYKADVIDNQKQQMLLTTQSLADNLELMVDEYLEDLTYLSDLCEKGIVDRGGQRAILKEYIAAHSEFVHAIAIEAEGERLFSSEENCGIVETTSTIRVNAQTLLYQVRASDGNIYLMLERTLDSGERMSLFLDSRAYYESMIAGIRLGSSGYVVVKDSDGIILLHPSQEQWGIDVIDGREELFPGKDLTSLSEMIERQNRGETGVSEYYSYWWMEPDAPRVKKISAYTPAWVGESYLTVSTVIDYNDIYVPVAEGVQKLMLVFAGVLLAVTAMGLFGFRLLLEKKKDREQIAYLTELNRILEQMHQSEETIAHQQRLQIMGTMTGGIAHEFNNLLTPIMGYADLLMMELEEGSDAYDSAQEIYEASAKAKEIIQQISSLSRKNMETAYKSMNARRVISRALKMVSSVCPGNVRLETELQLNGETIMGNETQLNQVFLNICVNAFHAIGREEGVLSVSAGTASRQELERCVSGSVPEGWDTYVRIDFRDNGCGMSSDTLQQIFDPFFTTKTGGKGTGLGLALVEQIVSSHKGYIYAQSVLGEGTVFHLYLPVTERAEEKMNSWEKVGLYGISGADAGEDARAAIAGEKESETLLRLLVVDDNPKVLKLLERNFGRLPVEMDSATSFEEAREKLREGSFDGVAAEQYIRGSSAVDFFMAVSGEYPQLIRIVMADQVTRELAEAIQRRIVDGYVDKPVSDTAILKAVRDARVS